MRELELDFHGVEYISSMGLRVILQTYKSCKKYNKKFHVTNIPEHVSKVFEVSGFIEVFLRDEKFVLLQTEKIEASTTFELAGNFENPNKLLDAIQKCLDGQYHPSMITIDCKKLINISQAASSAMSALSQKLKEKHITLIMQKVNGQRSMRNMCRRPVVLRINLCYTC